MATAKDYLHGRTVTGPRLRLADGNLRSASDNIGEISGKRVFTRAYGYDQVGGAKEAYSGSEADDFLNGTNSGTATGPYRQSFQHDAFGNITTNTSRFWSQFPTTTNVTYVNNRKQGTGITYDAEGHLTQDADLNYEYDAAGRSTSIWSPNGGKMVTPIYDGDGQVVHRTESEGSTSIPNFYQLRSSVLGGKVITELDSAGQKKHTYVYCNGQLIARQDYGWIVWQHETPFTGTRGSSTREGSAAIDVQLDPMGVDVGLYDPYPEPENWEPSEINPIGLLPGQGIPSGRCMLDGIPVFCADAEHLLHTGAAEFKRPDVVWQDGQWVFVKFNRETREYEKPVFSHYDYTSVTDGEGRSYGKWHAVFKGVSVSETANLFRAFAFDPSLSRGQGKKTPSTEPEKPVDFPVLQSALKTCIPELWPWFEMTGFTPTSPPGLNANPKDDRYNGVVNLRDKDLGTTFNVVNDPTLTPDAKKDIIDHKARGRTDANNPWWNDAYPQGNSTPRPGDLRYPELFSAISMDYVRVQIHELGSSLSYIRNIYHPGPGIPILPNDLDPGHDDDGPALEDCVGKKYYQQMGLTPHLKP